MKSAKGAVRSEIILNMPINAITKKEKGKHYHQAFQKAVFKDVIIYSILKITKLIQ